MEEIEDDRQAIREDMVVEETLEKELEKLEQEAERLEGERRKRQKLLEGGTPGPSLPTEEMGEKS